LTRHGTGGEKEKGEVCLKKGKEEDRKGGSLLSSRGEGPDSTLISAEKEKRIQNAKIQIKKERKQGPKRVLRDSPISVSIDNHTWEVAFGLLGGEK